MINFPLNPNRKYAVCSNKVNFRWVFEFFIYYGYILVISAKLGWDIVLLP